MALHTVHDYGDQALLLEFESTAEVLAWTEALREAELLGVLDIVPASRTVLIKLAGPRYQAPTRQRLGKLQRSARRALGTGPACRRPCRRRNRRRLRRRGPRRGGPAHRVDPGSGGRRAHRNPMAGRIRWVRTGFRLPGRRRPPPGGPTASRAAHEGARRAPLGWQASSAPSYPRESPGGWQLIGRTDAVLWDVDRDKPALLTAGHVGPVPRGRKARGTS